MATPGQRDAYRKVIHLIMEEIEGAELDPQAMHTVELMELVKELEQRIIEGPGYNKGAEKQRAFKFGKADIKPKPKPAPRKQWERGPLGGSVSRASEKPPWFEA